MARHLLVEQSFIARFIEAVFNSIVRERNQAIRKAAEQDPEFKQIVSKLQGGKQELEAWIERKRLEDPEFRSANDVVRAITQG